MFRESVDELGAVSRFPMVPTYATYSHNQKIYTVYRTGVNATEPPN